MWIRMSLSLSQLLGGFAARLQREEGQTMAEYALLLTLIIVVTVGVVALLGNKIAGVFTSVTGSI